MAFLQAAADAMTPVGAYVLREHFLADAELGNREAWQEDEEMWVSDYY